jgi:hypothetical protein
MASSQTNVPRPKKVRSAITNAPHRLPNTDMRSAAGRRFRDLVDGALAEFGASSTESIRELAGLKFTRELTQSAIIGGDTKATEHLVRLGRLIASLEATMRDAAAAAKAKTPSLSEYIAGKYGSVEEDDSR